MFDNIAHLLNKHLKIQTGFYKQMRRLYIWIFPKIESMGTPV